MMDWSDSEAVAKAIDFPLEWWGGQCHAVSLAIVKMLPPLTARVARGWCTGVMSQHSWVVLGMDCYDKKATIVDPTLHTYDDTVNGILVTTLKAGRHEPHGAGSIWNHGRPDARTGPAVELAVPVSKDASFFLGLAGPDGLDYEGWSFLAHAPVGVWPAGEILSAMADTPQLRSLVPVDRLGMLTDRNPNSLYLRTT